MASNSVGPGASPIHSHRCEICNKPADKFCSKCKVAYYCSIECQKGDWKRHKKICSFRGATSKAYRFLKELPGISENLNNGIEAIGWDRIVAMFALAFKLSSSKCFSFGCGTSKYEIVLEQALKSIGISAEFIGVDPEPTSFQQKDTAKTRKPHYARIETIPSTLIEEVRMACYIWPPPNDQNLLSNCFEIADSDAVICIFDSSGGAGDNIWWWNVSQSLPSFPIVKQELVASRLGKNLPTIKNLRNYRWFAGNWCEIAAGHDRYVYHISILVKKSLQISQEIDVIAKQISGQFESTYLPETTTQSTFIGAATRMAQLIQIKNAKDSGAYLHPKEDMSYYQIQLEVQELQKTFATFRDLM